MRIHVYITKGVSSFIDKLPEQIPVERNPRVVCVFAPSFTFYTFHPELFAAVFGTLL